MLMIAYHVGHMNEPFDGRTGFDWNAPLPNTTSGLFQWIADCYSAELKIHNPVQFNEWQMDRINKARDKLAGLRQRSMNTSQPFDWRSPLPDTIRGLELWLSDFETEHMYGPSGGFKIASDEVEKWKKAADATAKLKDLHQMQDVPDDTKPVVVGKDGKVATDPACALHGPEKQCCCNCKHHLPVNNHCHTCGVERLTRCMCGDRKGWACVPPGLGRVHDNWPEHDYGCEMYEAKQEVAK